MSHPKVLYSQINDCIYIFGSQSNNNCYLFKNNFYKLITKYPLSIYCLFHSIIFTNETQNKILSVGSSERNRNRYNHFLIYDLINNSWNTNLNINNPFVTNVDEWNGRGVQMILLNGFIHIFGQFIGVVVNYSIIDYYCIHIVLLINYSSFTFYTLN